MHEIALSEYQLREKNDDDYGTTTEVDTTGRRLSR